MYDYMKIFKKILKTQRVHEFVEVKEHPVITGNCIYAVNHSCKWDSQYLMELLPKRFSFLAGKKEAKDSRQNGGFDKRSHLGRQKK